MPYRSSVPFSGETDKAFGLAESALTALGFQITEHTAASLELVGPGMNSSRQSALVGASRIRVFRNRGELAIEADLGGVERMSRFVLLFPPGLCLTLAIVLSIVFRAQFGVGAWVAAIAPMGGIALLWLLIGPLMARGIRARTCRGLDALLANLAIVGEARQ